MTDIVEATVPLVTVRGLSVEFATQEGTVRAVDDVSFTAGAGEIIGLVGESASGKSTLGLSLLRAVPAPGRTSAEELRLEDRDLLGLSETELRTVRSAEIALVVQDALATMNPVTTIGEQITRILRDHAVPGTRREHRERAIRALGEVRLPDPEDVMRRYPHELSGGMQQRVAIAQGLILEPKLIIADEPTTALDVTVQAQILALLKSIAATHGTSIIFVTHDLATVAEIGDRVMVMYAGRIVESGPVKDVFRSPEHPYTRALLASLLPLGGEPPARLDAIPGQPPRPGSWPTGCRFSPRCPLYRAKGEPEQCRTHDPRARGDGSHWAACHFATEEESE
ncbi:ABC transporter ATP-binding protein [Microbacterium pseudoresistens]|uniref:Oligopeptide/dipeptide ABC transporter ATP-binding protein n=1 Tax=Microbacterium pseudoresistens TaxID=640634 RepID=A0A7Y9EST4_9MICO|nr:ABC transporter ATP-binding protein [Microbacterium pseudoresistens]NYD53295.1 oligopeptide/dipeptide ABC transporter ATP-binding protein [Microbacterium pseudoresistens]